MKKLFIIVSCILLLFSLRATAQRPGKNYSFGIGAEAGIVTGTYSSQLPGMLGISLRFTHVAGPGSITVTWGFDQFKSKLFTTVTQVPAKLGYKYLIGEHFFIMGEAGYSIMYTGPHGDQYTTEFSSGGFTFAPVAGIQIGIFEVDARFESVLLQGDVLSYGALRLGINF